MPDEKIEEFIKTMEKEDYHEIWWKGSCEGNIYKYRILFRYDKSHASRKTVSGELKKCAEECKKIGYSCLNLQMSVKFKNSFNELIVTIELLETAKAK